MMLAPNGIVLSSGRVRFWWLRLIDWMERKYAPNLILSRQKLLDQHDEITKLEELVDRIWP